MTKPQLRTQILSRREALSPEVRAEYSHKITQTLTSLPQFLTAETIHCYLSFGTEVDTSEIRLAAFAAGKRVAIPILEKNTPILKHCIIQEHFEFTNGHWNVPVPTGIEVGLLSAEELAMTEKDIIIVPLVAFDKEKHRLGYGKGFYDRFLQHEKALKIGIAFSLQEVGQIPFESHDEVLSMIITENPQY
ncbi:MAG: 5-formyltetrahydrofolate cyclo-ligase [Ignavibacteriae bacterium]|nr:5-formyltetrahydrofolate cyclo-ligase [Ignavibacteriota bacterium]